LLGAPVSAALARRRHLLATLFAVLVIVVGVYVVTHGLTDLMS
jgi:hypothetical protein